MLVQVGYMMRIYYNRVNHPIDNDEKEFFKTFYIAGYGLTWALSGPTIETDTTQNHRRKFIPGIGTNRLAGPLNYVIETYQTQNDRVASLHFLSTPTLSPTGKIKNIRTVHIITSTESGLGYLSGPYSKDYVKLVLGESFVLAERAAGDLMLGCLSISSE